MSLTLVRYDAARKALAAAFRFDEVRKIRNQAEAVRAYAQQARDYELQNRAASIRILAERRAGQMLTEMEKNPGTRGNGRPSKDNIKNRRSNDTTAYPPTLDEIGISRDQSSKWQRLAMMVDDATFEAALLRAKETYHEITTSGVLRMLKDVVKPQGKFVQPDINVVAVDLIREIESASRKERLQQVISRRNRLNPTIRKNLLSALENASKDAAAYAEQLSAGFQMPPLNGKAHQRVIREHMAQQPEPDIDEKRRLAADLKSAVVREISYDEAKNVILANEWLGNISAEFSFGIFHGSYLAGVCCFGQTAGTNVAASVCGEEHKHKVAVITRGACCFWAHPHSASFLTSRACKEMTKKGYYAFVSFADESGGEIGTVYQAAGHLYCSKTSPTEQFRTPDGKVHDSRQVSGLARDRRGGTLKMKRTRAEQKQLLLEQGAEFFPGTPKHRYVGFYGDRRMKRILRAALQWPVLPYPKRPMNSEPV